MPVIYDKAPIFVRPKVKPKRWGSVQDVQRAVRDYYENKLGVAAPVLYYPLWEGAGQKAINYGTSGEKLNADTVNGGLWVAQGIDLTNTSSQYLQSATASAFGIPDAITVLMSFKLKSLRNSNGVFSKTSTNLPTPFDSYVLSSGVLRCYIGDGSATAGHNIYVDSAALSANIPYIATFTFFGAGGRGYLKVGQTAVIQSAVFSYSLSDAVQYTRIGNRNDNATLTNSEIRLVAVFPQGVTQKQMSQLNATPYAAIQPRSFPSYFFVTTGGAGVTAPTSTLYGPLMGPFGGPI